MGWFLNDIFWDFCLSKPVDKSIDDPTVGTVRRQGLRSQTVSKQLFGDKTDNLEPVVWSDLIISISSQAVQRIQVQQGTDYPLRFDPFGGKFFSNAVIGARSQ